MATTTTNATNRKQKRKRVIERLDNGVTLNRVAFIKSAGLQGRYGIVKEIRAAVPMAHNIILERLDNGTIMHEYGMNLRNLTEKDYLDKKRLLEAELDALKTAWEKQIELQASNNQQ